MDNLALSPTLVFALLQQASSTKGFISSCYASLMEMYLDKYPSLACDRGVRDVGEIPGKLWEEALENVLISSLNVLQ